MSKPTVNDQIEWFAKWQDGKAPWSEPKSLAILETLNAHAPLSEFVRSVAEYDRYDGYSESEPEIETLRRVIADIENKAKQLVAALSKGQS